MAIPPMAVCVKPTIFERIILAFINGHLFRRRIIPAVKSNIPIARNISVKRGMLASSMKILASIMFDKMKKTAPVKIRLVNIRKPPILTRKRLDKRINHRI